MAVTLQDSFTGTDATSLEDHDPDVGGAGSWEPLGYHYRLGTPSTPVADLVIDDDRLSSVIDGSSDQRPPMHRNSTDPGADEYDLSATVSFPDAGDTDDSQFVFFEVRASASGTDAEDVDRYAIVFGPSFPLIRIDKVVDGDDDVGIESTTGTILAGAVRDVLIEVRSDGITVYLDESEVLSTDDTEITQRGRICVGMRSGHDDMWVDDLEVDDLTGAGAQDVSPDPVVIEATPGALTVEPGAVDVAPDPVTVETAAGVLSMSVGLPLEAPAVEAAPGAVDLSLGVPLEAPAVGVSPGAVSVETDALQVAPDPVVVDADPGSLSIATGAVDVDPDAVVVDVTAGVLAVALGVDLAGPAVGASPGAVTVQAAGAVTLAAPRVRASPGVLGVTGGEQAPPVPDVLTLRAVDEELTLRWVED